MNEVGRRSDRYRQRRIAELEFLGIGLADSSRVIKDELSRMVLRSVRAGATRAEIGRMLGLSRGRVCQMHDRAARRERYPHHTAGLARLIDRPGDVAFINAWRPEFSRFVNTAPRRTMKYEDVPDEWARAYDEAYPR